MAWIDSFRADREAGLSRSARASARNAQAQACSPGAFSPAMIRRTRSVSVFAILWQSRRATLVFCPRGGAANRSSRSWKTRSASSGCSFASDAAISPRQDWRRRGIVISLTRVSTLSRSIRAAVARKFANW